MKSSAKPSICIVGAGAVGLTVAVSLADSRANVSLLTHTREESRFIRSHGVSLRSDAIEASVSDLTVSDNPACATASDLVVVCVKCQDTRNAAMSLHRHISSQPVILLQNGAGTDNEFHEVIRAASLYKGIASFGANKEDRNHVRLFGKLSLTVVPCRGDLKRLPDIPCIDLELRQDTESVIWSKLCLNCAVNPVTALYQISNSDLLTHRNAWPLALSALAEAVQVARHKGIPLLYSDPETELRSICEATAGNHSSMARDLAADRDTEIDYINGYVVRAAHAAGIQTPVNTDLVKRIKNQ